MHSRLSRWTQRQWLSHPLLAVRLGLDADSVLLHVAIIAIYFADSSFAACYSIVGIADVVQASAVFLQQKLVSQTSSNITGVGRTTSD